MGKIIINFIGGTGSMVARAMARICPCGIYGDNNIKLYIWDKDTSSPTYKKTLAAINEYNNFVNLLDRNNSGITRTKISCDDTESDNELIRTTKKVFEKGENNIQNLHKLLNVTREDSKHILNLCFTKEAQIGKELKSGNYGMADLGAAVVKMCEQESFKPEFSDMIKEINSFDINGDDKVIIVYSAFGGTGASMGSELAKVIRRMSKNKKVKIYGIHMQPYFKPKSANNLGQNNIDYKNFDARASEVVKDYASNSNFVDGDNKIFDKYYYLGWHPLDETDDKYSEENEQDRKSHLCELLAAMAIADILICNDDEKIKGYRFTNDNNAINKISWDQLQIEDFKEKMINMFRFAFCAEYLSEDLLVKANDDKFISDNIINDIYANIFNKVKKEEIDIDSAKISLNYLKTACVGFVNYIKELQEYSTGLDLTSLCNNEPADKLNYDLVSLTRLGSGSNAVATSDKRIDEIRSVVGKRTKKNLKKEEKTWTVVIRHMIEVIYDECKIR